MPELVRPDVRYVESFRASHREWAGAHQDGSGVEAQHDLETAEGFADFVEQLRSASHTPRRAGLVTGDFYWIVEDGEYLGSIALRHELNDVLADRGGHIGYGVRPSARRRGLATWALGQVLSLARERGLERVLVTCDDDNEGSWRTIESNGGVLDDVRTGDDGVRYRRYWIDLTGPAAG